MTVERFVQVETGLRRSKLVDRLRDQLGITVAEAVGHLVLLWSAALDARTRGDLSERSDRWIEEEAGWQGEPGRLARVLREVHLDSNGVIRDFEQKYGKLDVNRGKATRLKADQRKRAREDRVDSPEDGREDVVALSSGQSDGHTEDCPRILSYSSSSSVVDLEKDQRQKELEISVGREVEALRARHADAIGMVEARFGDKALWPLGLLRGARSPEAVAATLCGHLDGMYGPQYSPEVVALAAMQYAASDEPVFKPIYFAGFCRRAEEHIARTNARVQGQNETRFVRGEVEEREREAFEEAAIEREINEFAAAEPALHAEMVETADRAVPKKLGPMVRVPMVRAEVLRLIREEKQVRERVTV